MLRALAFSSALLLALPTMAQNYDPKDFSVFLGAGVGYAPDYLGSDDSEAVVIPQFEVSWQKGLFLSSRNGAGFYLFNDPSFVLGVSVAPEWGRDEDDNARLNGLGDIDTGPAMKLFLEKPVGPVTFHAGLTSEFDGGHGGTYVDAAVSYTAALTDSTTLTITPSTTWVDKTYARAFFGVNDVQSTNSGLPVFAINSRGIRDVSLAARVNQRITDQWGLFASARYMRLVGDAADSPITQSEDQFFIATGLAWRWHGDAPFASTNTNLPARR